MAQDRDRCRANVNTVLKRLFPYGGGTIAPSALNLGI